MLACCFDHITVAVQVRCFAVVKKGYNLLIIKDYLNAEAVVNVARRSPALLESECNRLKRSQLSGFGAHIGSPRRK